MTRIFRAFLALAVLIASPLAAQMSFTNPGAVASGGSVTSVAVTTANGVSGTVANPTTTPAISVTLGAITPSSVAASGNVTGSNLSGTNTGDQTTVSGQAGSVANAVTFDNSGSGAASGTTFNGSAAKTVSTNTIGALKASNNLSDVTAATARTNLGLGTAATQSSGTFLQVANNLSDVASTTTAALNLASCIVLAQSAVAVSHTGDTAEFTLATVTLPAGALGANGRLLISDRFTYSGAGGSRTPRIKFGGTTIGSIASGSTVTADRYNVDVANRNSQSSQFSAYDRLNSAGTSSMAYTTTAIDSSSAVTILITGQLANSGDTITLESNQISFCPKA